MASEKQSKAQPVQRNNDPDGTQRTITETEIDDLVCLFQLLDEWDREAQALKVVQNGKTR
jgi:hypothetical protein